MEYVENRIAITKLEAKQKVADIGSSIAALVPAALFGLFALIFLSIGLAAAFNVWLDSRVWGFLIVGVIYLVGAYVMFSQRDAVWLKKKIVDGSTEFLKEKPKQDKKEGADQPEEGYHAPHVEHKKVIFEETTVDREPVSNADKRETSNATIIVESETEEDRRP